MGHDVDAAPGRTERLIPYMRQAMGDGFDLSADANGGFSVGRAIRIGRLLEEYGYFFFEEPCPFTDIERTAQVAAALDIPVAGGEQDNSLPQFQRMLMIGAVDIVQPDVGYLGGIARTRKVATLADIAGIPCTPHCSNHSMLQVFVLHLAASMPACFQYQEWSIEPTPWTDEIYESMLRVVGGEVAVPQAPGWGVEILPSFLSQAQHMMSRADASPSARPCGAC
jgi:L-alanine-DL-glutamate epimerase-like enolase superfamily enzyme